VRKGDREVPLESYAKLLKGREPSRSAAEKSFVWDIAQ